MRTPDRALMIDKDWISDDQLIITYEHENHIYKETYKLIATGRESKEEYVR